MLSVGCLILCPVPNSFPNMTRIASALNDSTKHSCSGPRADFLWRWWPIAKWLYGLSVACLCLTTFAYQKSIEVSCKKKNASLASDKSQPTTICDCDSVSVCQRSIANAVLGALLHCDMIAQCSKEVHYQYV